MPTVSEVSPGLIRNGDTIEVLGSDFGSVEGRIILSPSQDPAHPSASAQSVSSWAEGVGGDICTNGDFETDTTGWDITSATMEVSTEQARFNSRSVKITATDIFQALFDDFTLTAVAHTASAYVYVPSSYHGTGLALFRSLFTGATGETTAQVNMSLRDQWQQVEITFTPGAGDLTGRVRVGDISTGNAQVGDFFYVDGFQIVAGSAPQPFVDEIMFTVSVGAFLTGSVYLFVEHDDGSLSEPFEVQFLSDPAPVGFSTPLPTTSLDRLAKAGPRGLRVKARK